MESVKLSQEEYQEKVRQNLEHITRMYDPDFTRNLAVNVLSILEEVYFRPVFIGFDEPIKRNNPDHPVILVSNHSGMAFPWDAIVFGAGFFKRMGYVEEKSIKALVAPMLSQTDLMNPYMIRRCWHRVGGVDATFVNFESMMHIKNNNVLIYPEGVPGIGKGWNRKYQLQRFATSFVRMSLKYRTDVVPFYSINGENINPYSYSYEWINKIVQKIGIPFLPVSLLLILLPIQPWMFYYAWPAKIHYVKGRRLRPYEWIDKPFEEIDEKDIQQIRDRIHAAMQEELDGLVQEYGKKPYDWKEHLGKIWKNRKYFPYFLPWGWLFLFHEFMRLWNKRQPGEDISIKLGFGSFFRMMFRNPITIAYFIPILGWIPLILKGYRGGIRDQPKRYVPKK